MTVFRFFVLATISALISACGGLEQRSVGLEANTHVTIFANDLLGATVALDGRQVLIIEKQDLLDFEVGVLGAKDSKRESLDAYRLVVTQGIHVISVGLPTGLQSEKEMYFSQGQQREWFLE